MRRIAPIAALLAAALAGCGGDDPATTAEPARTPEPAVAATPDREGSAADAFIGSIAVDPADGTLYLGTGLGLYVSRDGRRARRVTGELRTPQGAGEVSSNLVVRFAGPGELLASGHPEGPGSLPEDLGLIRSRDGGRTWEPVSEVGETDHHVLQVSPDRIVAVEAEGADVRISADGGRTFTDRTPPTVSLDAAIDPGDPERLVVATDQGIYTSVDGGGSWRQRDAVPAAQLAWAAPDALYRADADGLVRRSADGGQTWEDRGTLDLGANELAADAAGALYASLPGGEVHRSDDGGATWRRYLVLR